MEILVTGATGFLGGRLCAALAARGDAVRVLSRDPDRALATVPGARSAFRTPAPGEALPPEALSGVDAVVNLAGEPIASGRWTEARKARIRDSRVGITRAIAEGLRQVEPRPGVLVSASAIGYYGARGDEPLDEGAPPGEDFLARVCRDWEAEALRAQVAGVRVAIPRIGLVLGREGGALPRLLPPFRFGLGGRLGSGDQWMSWIHVEDAIGIILLALSDPRAEGPINAVAPNPVRNREFTRVLARTLRRPAALPVPAFALHLVLGEMADALLSGQRVVPARARELGYAFRHPDLEGALASLLGGEPPGGAEARA